MKFLCPACDRLTEVRAFRLEGSALALLCGACGEEGRVEPPEGAAPPADHQSPVSPASSPGQPLGAAKEHSKEAAPPASADLAPAGRRTGSGHGGGGGGNGTGAQVLALHPSPIPPLSEAGALAVPEGRCPKCIAKRPPQHLSCGQCGLVFDNFDPSQSAPSADLARAWQSLLAAWSDEEAHQRFRAQAAVREELPAAGRLYRIALVHRPQDPFALRAKEELLRLVTQSHLTPSAPRPPGRRVLAVAIAFTVGALALLTWAVLGAS